jgi:hypothetical protein
MAPSAWPQNNRGIRRSGHREIGPSGHLALPEMPKLPKIAEIACCLKKLIFNLDSLAIPAILAILGVSVSPW